MDINLKVLVPKPLEKTFVKLVGNGHVWSSGNVQNS